MKAKSLYSSEEVINMEFQVKLRSVQQVQEFVDLATARPFPLWVSDSRHRVNGKSFMEMFCLNFSHQLTVTADCSQEALDLLKQDMAHFLV